MAGRSFVKFHLDVGIGDVIVDPVQVVQTRDWLGFAGIPTARVCMIQSEQQFAEKIHAYTLPRRTAANSRVRDLVDLALLVQSGTMDPSRVAEALRRTFARRGTHDSPKRTYGSAGGLGCAIREHGRRVLAKHGRRGGFRRGYAVFSSHRLFRTKVSSM